MARRMQKSSRKSRNSISPPPQQFCPAVSVIIPMYNAEKYVAECLDSILAQTFTNFEVIVVDDCSTDSSCAIVESYIPKFDGRLKLYHMEKNSGSGAMPRNKGMLLSRGEYVFFMDADDLFTKTALEELYSLAKDYAADFVYIEKYYEASNDLKENHIRGINSGGFVDKPTFESENLIERLKSLLSGKYGVTPWTKFTKRDLSIDNELFFPHVKIGEDDIWTYSSVFYAKKLLRIPNSVYIQRLATNSITRTKRTPAQQMLFRINPLILGLKSLNKLICNHDFFKSNPQYRYTILNYFANAVFTNILTRAPALAPNEFYETIKQEFGDKLGEQDVLVSALCTLVNTQQKMFVVNQQKFNEFAAQAQKRIAELEARLK